MPTHPPTHGTHPPQQTTPLGHTDDSPSHIPNTRPQLSVAPANAKLLLLQDPDDRDSLAKTTVTLRASSHGGGGGVLFKIKTTCPKRYLVRPNQGILGAGERKDVAIIISAEKQAEARDEMQQQKRGSTNKFQVQTLHVDEAAYTTIRTAPEGEQQVGGVGWGANVVEGIDAIPVLTCRSPTATL